MPVRNEVSAAEIMMPPTATRFCGAALCHMAMAAAGRPNILKRNAPASIPAVGSPAKKRLMSPCTTVPLASLKAPISKKKGTFQMWCRPKGIRSRSTKP